MLRKIRIILAVILFLPITFYFLDFAGWLPKSFSWLEKIQFLPALLAGNLIVLGSLIVLTFLFGRVYCSVICPLGILQDISTRIRKLFVKKKVRYKFRFANDILRYSFLSVTIVALIAGFHFLVGLLDPYSAFGRISLHLFKPVYQAGNNLLAAAFESSGQFYKVGIYSMGLLSIVVAIVTLVVVTVMSWKNGRLYCNTVCPVGTMLGFFSRFSLFRIYFDETKCNSCASCAIHCKASCIDYKNMQVDATRCINCFNCLPVCKQSGLKYGFKPVGIKQILSKNDNKSTQSYRVDENTIADPSRRKFFMVSGAATLAATQLLAGDKIPGVEKQNAVVRKSPIMPPGALNIDHFSEKCTSCHLCVSKCPSQVIKPALLEYGIGGIMQPVLDFKHGFCNYDCTDCADICPTGALIPMTKEAKNHLQMGQVQLNLDKCIVVTDETNCGACSEHCPTQAVSMKDWKNALTIPQIDQKICVGCGGCEYICPAKPDKAIYVEGQNKQLTIELVKAVKEEIEVNDFGF